MKRFKVIPVLDLLDRKIVHAVKGVRENYKPLESYLFNNPDLNSVIDVLYSRYKFDEFYVADLNAIMKREPNYELILDLIKKPYIRILLDPGITNLGDIFKYSSLGIKNLILGLETLDDRETIIKSIQQNLFKKIYLSVDMHSEKIITGIKEYQKFSVSNVIKDINDLGISKIILLDLNRVGSKEGGIPVLYKEIKGIFEGEIFVGGGIKDLNDILDYYHFGFSGVLIGTALYDGTINLDEIMSLIDKNNS
jgi:phosphoribosylformimino-5-aminoimidazole carboxamide ribotide isomerase